MGARGLSVESSPLLDTMEATEGAPLVVREAAAEEEDLVTPVVVRETLVGIALPQKKYCINLRKGEEEVRDRKRVDG